MPRCLRHHFRHGLNYLHATAQCAGKVMLVGGGKRAESAPAMMICRRCFTLAIVLVIADGEAPTFVLRHRQRPVTNCMVTLVLDQFVGMQLMHYAPTTALGPCVSPLPFHRDRRHIASPRERRDRKHLSKQITNTVFVDGEYAPRHNPCFSSGRRIDYHFPGPRVSLAPTIPEDRPGRPL